MRRPTRRVRADDVRAMLEAPPRANIAFRVGDAVEAAPVAFRHQSGRYWFGLPRTGAGPTPAPGDVVKLLIDDGRWFFDLRGVWIRGRTIPTDRPPEGASPSLAWFELTSDKVVAWHYGTLREVDDGT